MQLILHQLLHSLWSILPTACVDHICLHLEKSSRLHLIPAPAPLLICACCLVENIKLKSHIAKGKLHYSIPAIDYGIRCGKKWPPKYDRNMVSALRHHRLRIKNYKVHRIIKVVHLHQNILSYALMNLYQSIS